MQSAGPSEAPYEEPSTVASSETLIPQTAYHSDQTPIGEEVPPRSYSNIGDVDETTENDIPWRLRLRQACCSKEGSFILILVILTITISAFDWLLWKKSLNKFHSKTTDTTYTFFVLQVYIFTMLVFSSVSVFLLIFVFKVITIEERRFPQKYFIIMSAFDTVSQLFSSMSSAVVAGHIQTLLNQAMLPLVMFFSIMFLATYYVPFQYLGAAFILGGTLLAAIPSVNATDLSGRKTKLWGIILYSLSSIPYAGGNVYREYLFKTRESLNILYLMFWTGFYQFLLSFLLLPLLALPIFGGVPLSKIPTQFSNGARCLAGYHVEELECHIGVPPAVYLFSYIVLNFLVSILRLMLIKRASALMLQITNALALLASNLLFSVKFIMGEDTEKFNLFDLMGLCVVMIGFIVFRIASFQKDSIDARLELEHAANQLDQEINEKQRLKNDIVSSKGYRTYNDDDAGEPTLHQHDAHGPLSIIVSSDHQYSSPLATDLSDLAPPSAQPQATMHTPNISNQDARTQT